MEERCGVRDGGREGHNALTEVLDTVLGSPAKVLKIVNGCVSALFFVVTMMIYQAWHHPATVWLYLGLAGLLACFAFTVNWLMASLQHETSRSSSSISEGEGFLTAARKKKPVVAKKRN
eukprot:GHVS01011190.1.p1 GENE.GHVS01011190.1~~GHVS01011190.1.p1  ORF type:complete len:119 (-),score=26.45 GHVS01011190.1:117-473(-)